MQKFKANNGTFVYAVQWTGSNVDDVKKIFEDPTVGTWDLCDNVNDGVTLTCFMYRPDPCLEGTICDIGDWLVKSDTCNYADVIQRDEFIGFFEPVTESESLPPSQSVAINKNVVKEYDTRPQTFDVVQFTGDFEDLATFFGRETRRFSRDKSFAGSSRSAAIYGVAGFPRGTPVYCAIGDWVTRDFEGRVQVIARDTFNLLFCLKGSNSPTRQWSVEKCFSHFAPS